MSVVKLVHNEEPKAPKFLPCSTCAYFVPATRAHGWEREGWFKPKNPTSNAIRFGICGALGGDYASITRLKCDGDWHSEREV